MGKIIVLTTGGKNQDAYKVHITLFDTMGEAEAFIEQNSDTKDEKYWTYSEIINEGVTYEIDRYKNHTYD